MLWVPQALALNTDLGFEAADTAVRIAGNGILLAELLNNLVDNALRYTPPGGHITVRVRPTATHATLAVEDSVPGPPPQYRRRSSQRIHTVLGPTTEGSGPGL